MTPEEKSKVNDNDLMGIQNKFLTTKEVWTKRLNICKECEYYTWYKTCSECGCFMVVKTKIKDESCPRNKW